MSEPTSVLPQCTNAFHELRGDMKVIRMEMSVHDKLIDKLSLGIEKIEEMNTNLVKMLAIHDEKHETHDEIENDIETDIKELHSRITSESRETQEKIDDLKKEINVRFDRLQQEVTTRTSASPTTESNPTAEVQHHIDELKRWKYMLMGAIFVIGYLMAHLNWEVVHKIFNLP